MNLVNNPYPNEFSRIIKRREIQRLESEMLKLPQADLPLKHYFSEGIYARELFLPKDAVVVGKIHKYKHLLIIIKGELSFSIDDVMTRVKAPFTVVSTPGTKRAIYAHEDSIMMTIHRTDEVDLAKIENSFVASSEQEWLEFCKNEPMLPLEGDVKCLT